METVLGKARPRAAARRSIDGRPAYCGDGGAGTDAHAASRACMCVAEALLSGRGSRWDYRRKRLLRRPECRGGTGIQWSFPASQPGRTADRFRCPKPRCGVSCQSAGEGDVDDRAPN